MTIAISGISGFLGKYIADYFAVEHPVFGISTSEPNGKFPIFSFEQLGLAPIPEVVIHCHAAVVSGIKVLDSETLFSGNVKATETIVKNFSEAVHIYISSVSVYGNYFGTIDEKATPAPVSGYAVSKYWGENIVLNAAKSAVVRLSSIFGNGMKENTLIPNYTNQALKTKQIEVWGKGERKQNYIHISDVARLVEAIILKQAWSRAVFLGVAEQEYSNLEIAKIIAGETMSEIIFKNSDHALSVHYNNIFTQNSLNWQPETTLSEGLKQYLAWKKRQS